MKRKAHQPNNKGTPIYNAWGVTTFKHHRVNATLAKSKKPRSQTKTDLKMQVEIAIEEEVV